MIGIQIRPFHIGDIDDIVRVSLLAWKPVFASFRHVLGPTIFSMLYPDSKASQQSVVETICRNQEQFTTWVAEHETGLVRYYKALIDE